MDPIDITDLTEKLTQAEKSLMELEIDHKALQREHSSLKTELENKSAQLKTTTKQRDELSNLLKSIAEREEVQTERQMIEQIAKLEEEVNRLRKEAAAKAPNDVVSSRMSMLSSRRPLDSKSEAPVVRESLATELKGLIETPNDAERRKVLLEELYLKGNKTALFDFVNQEITSIGNKASHELDIIAQGFEAMLKDQEEQTEFYLTQKNEAEERSSHFSTQIKQLTIQVGSLNSKIAQLLKDTERLTIDNENLEKKNAELSSELERTQKAMDQKAFKELKAKETEFLNAIETIELLERENTRLKSHSESLSKAKSSSESIMTQNDSQVEGLMKKLSLQIDEVSKLRKRNEHLLLENQKLIQQLESKTKEFDDMRIQQADFIDSMQVKHAAQIKQIEKRASITQSVHFSQVSERFNLMTDSTLKICNEINPGSMKESILNLELSNPLPLPQKLVENELERDGDALYFVSSPGRNRRKKQRAGQAAQPGSGAQGEALRGQPEGRAQERGRERETGPRGKAPRGDAPGLQEGLGEGKSPAGAERRGFSQ